MALGKIIEDGDGVPGIEQQLGADAPDVARAADDENLHRASCRAVARDVNGSVILSAVEGSRGMWLDAVPQLRFAPLGMTTLTFSVPVPRSFAGSGDFFGAG